MADIAYSDSFITENVRRIRTGVRQKPFRDPLKELPYTIQDTRASVREAWGGKKVPGVATGGTGSNYGLLYSSVMVQWGSSSIPNWAKAVYSKLYNKLLSKTGERASLLTALAEWRSTSDMVLNRLTQIYKGIKSLRKGRFRDFLKVFSLVPKNRHKHTRWTKPRDAAGLWLEYWFGWAPTIGDIQNAIAVFTGKIPSEKVRVSSGTGLDLSVKRAVNGQEVFSSTHGARYIMQLRAEIQITNPNLYLANASGLLNPLRTAWETTPFSWFADWFTNVGQVLGYLTDQLGVSISDVWLTRFAKGVESYRCDNSVYGSGFLLVREHAFVNRVKLGKLPRPELIIRVPKLSWTRGATLSSLIVTFFAPERTKRA